MEKYLDQASDDGLSLGMIDGSVLGSTDTVSSVCLEDTTGTTSLTYQKKVNENLFIVM